jgi:uncharacterized protein
MHSETIVDFCRFLRDNGFHLGVPDTLSATEIARTLNDGGLCALQHGLRAALCTSKEEWDAFDALFEAFLAGAPPPGPKPQRGNPPQTAVALALLNGITSSTGQELERDAKTVAVASVYERLTQTDLADVERENQAALERIAQKLFNRAASRLSRRLNMGRRRSTLDLRRTIHRSVGRGGEIIDLRYRGRKRKKPSLVILLDVSGSMNRYSLFLLRFAHALQRHFRQTHTFVFSTRLIDVTMTLRPPEIADALKALSGTGVNWSGGTKIGDSLQVFNALYARKLLSRDTLLLILSDGWDTGEPTRLASEMRVIREKVRKLIWLNPLLGLEEYQPTTRAMAAALPYLDVFAPAHSIESLAQLDKHLCSINS